jgi:hypothetical protein
MSFEVGLASGALLFGYQVGQCHRLDPRLGMQVGAVVTHGVTSHAAQSSQQAW